MSHIMHVYIQHFCYSRSMHDLHIKSLFPPPPSKKTPSPKGLWCIHTHTHTHTNTNRSQIDLLIKCFELIFWKFDLLKWFWPPKLSTMGSSQKGKKTWCWSIFYKNAYFMFMYTWCEVLLVDWIELCLVDFRVDLCQF